MAPVQTKKKIYVRDPMIHVYGPDILLQVSRRTVRVPSRQFARPFFMCDSKRTTSPFGSTTFLHNVLVEGVWNSKKQRLCAVQPLELVVGFQTPSTNNASNYY